MAEKTFKVLALDGGGIRGIIPATVLTAIEERTGKRIAELFDLIVGTSTGGILTFGLTVGTGGRPRYHAQDLLDIYMQRAGEIFKPWCRLYPSSGKPIPIWLGLFNPRYSARGVESLLKEKFGDATLGQNVRAASCVSYDIAGPRPYFFRTWSSGDSGIRVIDAVRATSAAPTYFPPKPFSIGGRKGRFVDGGTVANNPAVVGLSEAIQYLGTQPGNDDYTIDLVSIGTGEVVERFSSGGGGIVGWLRGGLFNLVLDGGAQVTNEEATLIFPPPPPAGAEAAVPRVSFARYWRYNAPLVNPPYYRCAPELDDWTEQNRKALHAAGKWIVDHELGTLDTALART